MGTSSSVVPDKASDKKNKEIEEYLQKSKIEEAQVVKLLLLGAGESGKSTLAKQMRILYAKGFDEKERLSYKSQIISNLLENITTILDAMQTLGIDFDNNDSKKDATLIWRYHKVINHGSFLLTPEIVESIKSLWEDKGVKQTFARASEYQLNDSTEYFFDSATLDRISSENFVPTDEDIIRARMVSTGVTETKFPYKKYTLKLFDVGGQRSERRKWIHCFDNVTAVIFTVAMSEYDQTLREDQTVNRLHESRNLFRSICNHKVFLKTPMILFLNKKDIFKKKILLTSLDVCFPDYTGKNEYNQAADFIRQKFECLKRVKKAVYVHFTNATDRGNVDFVFDAAMSVALQKNLEDTGMF